MTNPIEDKIKEFEEIFPLVERPEGATMYTSTGDSIDITDEVESFLRYALQETRERAFQEVLEWQKTKRKDGLYLLELSAIENDIKVLKDMIYNQALDDLLVFLKSKLPHENTS